MLRKLTRHRHRDLEKLAGSIADTLSSEFYTHCVVGIGTTVTGIKDLARSFKEAQSALEVAKVFDTERTIVSYDNLGIARLIYQLPTTLCEMFLKRFSRKVQLKVSIRKHFSQFSVSLKITSMFQRLHVSSLYTVTHWFTDLKKSKNLAS